MPQLQPAAQLAGLMSRAHLLGLLRAPLTSRAGTYLLANLVTAAVPIVLIPVLTRALSPADYGRATMFLLVVTVAGTLTGVNAHGALSVRYFQVDRATLAGMVHACLILLVASAAVVSALVLVLGRDLAPITGVPGRWLLAAVGVASLQFVLNIGLALWTAAGRAFLYSLVQVGRGSANVGLSLALVVGAGMAWEGRALGVAAASAMSAAVVLAVLLRGGWVRADGRLREHLRELMSFGLPLVPHAIGGLLMVATDRFVIAQQLGVARVGVYMIAVQIGSVLSLVTDAVNRSYAPWLMRSLANPDDRGDREVVRRSYAYFVALLILAGVIAAAAPFVLRVVVGEQYRGASAIVGFIALGVAFNGCYYTVTNYVFFAQRTRHLAVVTVLSGLVNAPLTALLVHLDGVRGAAGAFALTHLICFLATWRVAHRVHPMPWRAALSRVASPVGGS